MAAFFFTAYLSIDKVSESKVSYDCVNRRAPKIRETVSPRYLKDIRNTVDLR
jgi:hypothetical protein